MTTSAALIVIGFLVGAFGTMIGAGGGFILVPLLLILYPKDSPEVITAISLAIVFFNSASGSIAYARLGKINFRAGVIFAIASLPGAVLGALAVSKFSRSLFEPIFGILIISGGIILLIQSYRQIQKDGRAETRLSIQRSKLFLGIILSAIIGFISSILGIGGGIIHVPVLIHWLEFPVATATATSHFVLAIMSLVGTLVHLQQGSLVPALDRILYIGIPAVFGAQVGAWLSHKLHEYWITRSLAGALILVGIRLLFF